MSLSKFEKHSKDSYPVRVAYLNEDQLTQYVIEALVVTAIDKASGDDVADTVLDDSRHSFSGNTAFVWVRAGYNGSKYDIEVSADMETGETLTKQLLMVVKDD